MTDTYCIDYDNYLADKNDDDENDDGYGNDDVKQQRQMVMPGKVILQQIKTYIETCVIQTTSKSTYFNQIHRTVIDTTAKTKAT